MSVVAIESIGTRNPETGRVLIDLHTEAGCSDLTGCRIRHFYDIDYMRDHVAHSCGITDFEFRFIELVALRRDTERWAALVAFVKAQHALVYALAGQEPPAAPG